MSIPKEPRQQMINIMYLVLTALLALNVSAEVINAFKKVNGSLENSTNNIIGKNAATYSALAEKVANEGSDEAKLYEQAALQTQSVSKSFYDYVASVKQEIIDYVGTDEVTGDMKKMDDLNASTVIMLGRDNAGGRAQELKQKIIETRANLLAVVPEQSQEKFNTSSISLEEPLDDTMNDGKTKVWELSTFESIPAIAAMTNLTKLQSDIKNTESNMITFFSSEIGATDIKFDQFKVGIVPSSTYLLQGEELEVEAFLAAFSSKSEHVSVNIGGVNVPLKEGIATRSFRVSGIGEKTLPVRINIFNPATGETDTKEEILRYKVGSQATTISASAMNVLFIGLDNPIEVGVSGIQPEDVQASISGGGGNLSGSRGNYTATVTTQGTATISVSAKGKSAGNKDFRVMRVPDPVAKVGGKVGGSIRSAELKAQRGVQAVLENFYFDGVKFNVISFSMVYAAKRQDIVTASGTGAGFTSQMQDYLSRVKPGDAMWFEAIRAKGPDGQARKLPPIAFKVQ